MSSAVACSTRLEGTPVQGEDATVTQPQCLSNFIQVDERAEMISVHSWVHKEAWALGPPLDVTLLAYEEHAGHAQPQVYNNLRANQAPSCEACEDLWP